MKRLFAAIIALFALCTAAFAGEDDKVEGWNIGILPCVSYNSDLGFQYGVCADIFNYGSIYPEYRQRMYVEASRYTGGQTLLHGQFDSRYLIPGIRTTFSASYQYDPMFLFYGLNGLEPYDKSLDANKETRTARYAYQRSMVRILADFQGPILPHLNWVGGLSYWYYGIDDIKMDAYDAENTLYHQMRSAGVFRPREEYGGHRVEVKAGLVYDTRDNESAPNSGLWMETYLIGSPDLYRLSPYYFYSGSNQDYLRLAAHLRHYISLWPDRMVFAYHLAYQGVIAGEAPFYSMQNISTLFLRQTCTDGLGGINTVRGLLAQRLVGDSYAWMNSELRIKLFDFKLIGQNWYLATNPLFDAGMVTRLYKGEELSRFYGRSVSDLQAEALKLHCSAGAGIKLVMNTNFIISAEWAKPFLKTDGDSALYIALNYIF
ncbi:MAG: BamA/TamA family outer membrane protein [Bacteroidales bacterium]|nr:BamA/TamA family outer membrane protein [Bacteroidales bacterium]